MISSIDSSFGLIEAALCGDEEGSLEAIILSMVNPEPRVEVCDDNIDVVVVGVPGDNDDGGLESGVVGNGGMFGGNGKGKAFTPGGVSGTPAGGPDTVGGGGIGGGGGWAEGGGGGNGGGIMSPNMCGGGMKGAGGGGGPAAAAAAWAFWKAYWDRSFRV